MVGDFLNPALCLHIIREASRNRGLCVRSVGKQFLNTPAEVLDCLADLALAGVIDCRPTGVPGFLSLALGPKSLQAIFLFALNCDVIEAESPAAISAESSGGTIVNAADRAPAAFVAQGSADLPRGAL